MAALTSDGWTACTRDHYLTVTLHYVIKDHLYQKVLKTQACYKSKTGLVVAEEIEAILKEFGLDRNRIVAVTVDNASNMDIAVKRMKILKVGCFAHTLNLGAQKAIGVTAVSNWLAKKRSVIVWLRKTNLAKVVMKEKQPIAKVNAHELVLDVKTRWNSTYAMLERFVEQYPAIQATVLDPRIRKGAQKDKLERITDADFRKADDFIKLKMKILYILYTSTLAVSSEKTPTCGQILPILQKLENHYKVTEDDSSFAITIKENVWTDLSQRYQDDEVAAVLEEATIMNPRFKNKVNNDKAWERLKRAAVMAAGPESDPERHQLPAREQDCTERESDSESEEPPLPLGQGTSMILSDEDGEQQGEEGDIEEMQSQPPKKLRLTPLEYLFAEEEKEVRKEAENIRGLSSDEKVDKEISDYKALPPQSMKTNPVAWWWRKRKSLPMLYTLSAKYLCVQASSTPAERVFSMAGDRCRIRPEKADQQIFLQKNCGGEEPCP